MESGHGVLHILHINSSVERSSKMLAPLIIVIVLVSTLVDILARMTVMVILSKPWYNIVLLFHHILNTVSIKITGRRNRFFEGTIKMQLIRRKISDYKKQLNVGARREGCKNTVKKYFHRIFNKVREDFTDMERKIDNFLMVVPERLVELWQADALTSLKRCTVSFWYGYCPSTRKARRYIKDSALGSYIVDIFNRFSHIFVIGLCIFFGASNYLNTQYPKY